MNHLISTCYEEYSALNQEKGSFSAKWQTFNGSSSSNSTHVNVYDSFRYTQADRIDSFPYAALVHTYYGGGYVFKMTGNAATLVESISLLEQLEWIDKQTAAIFVEFTLYNPNVNLYQYCSIVFEILISGSFVNTAQFTSLELVTSLFSTQMLSGLIFLLFLLVFMCVELRSIVKKRLSYFKDFYSYIDLLVIAFAWASFSFFLYRSLFFFHSQIESKKELKKNYNFRTFLFEILLSI